MHPTRVGGDVDISAALEDAVTAFATGKPVCLFDSKLREGETDLLWLAERATPAVMRQLRQDAGGLLFLAIADEVGAMFDLPWLQEMHAEASARERFPVLDALVTDDLRYDARSAFTLPLNHRDTFTGITDKDRALTVRRFAELTGEMFDAEATVAEARVALGKEFRTPGHVPVCRAVPGGLVKRRGHTELSVALAELAEALPVVIGAEMLAPDGDEALSYEDARIWAAERGIPFVEGAHLVEAMEAVASLEA